MSITALASWYGSNRMLAENVGQLLRGMEWVGVPFAGGMCELGHIDARTMLVSDLHRHVINLARTVKTQREALQREADATGFHPDELAAAQRRCIDRESAIGFFGKRSELADDGELAWAIDYFVCAWMARNATAGTDGELKAGLATRWNASGGDSAVRFRSATESLAAWEKVFRRCTFVCLDIFDFLAEALKRDQWGHGLYLDPPFPGPGDKYKHKFDEAAHRRMAARLGEFRHTLIVCRFYDHPLVRELYPESGSTWTWRRLQGRKQSNNEAPEVLLVNDGLRIH